MIDQLWMILLGFAAGILGSMIGLGGGIIVVPVLTFLGFPPTVAASNSLFAALSNATASTISYSRQKRIEFSLGDQTWIAHNSWNRTGCSNFQRRGT